MRHTTRILTIGMMTMLALSGTAAADPGLTGHLYADSAEKVAHATGSLTSDHGSAAGEALVNGETRYADGDANVSTDDAAGALDTDASTSDVTQARESGVFGWLQISFTAVSAKVQSVLAKLGFEHDLSGDAEAYVSDDGVDLDANVLGHDFDGSPAGKADDHTWTTMGKVKEAAPTVG